MNRMNVREKSRAYFRKSRCRHLPKLVLTGKTYSSVPEMLRDMGEHKMAQAIERKKKHG